MKETLIGFEIVKDNRNRSFPDIAKEIDELTLGQLKQRYLETIGKRVDDPVFEKMWKEINQERFSLCINSSMYFPLRR